MEKHEEVGCWIIGSTICRVGEYCSLHKHRYYELTAAIRNLGLIDYDMENMLDGVIDITYK